MLQANHRTFLAGTQDSIQLFHSLQLGSLQLCGDGSATLTVGNKRLHGYTRTLPTPLVIVDGAADAGRILQVIGIVRSTLTFDQRPTVVVQAPGCHSHARFITF
uniref:Chromosome transmission fidelity protein 8 n=1 Tax=Lygus hesperus TaxID=30085 RepID=A0A0A9W260_LYGHE